MIIKVEPISASHGHNAINYAMDKDGKDKPELLRLNHLDLDDGVTFSQPSPKDVWDLMKLHQGKYRFHRDDMFVRVELCPPMEKCKNWEQKDWDDFLDRCLRLLDDEDNYYKKVPMKNKDGSPKLDKDGNQKYRTIGEPFMFKKAQFVAAIHRDTGNWHVHLIANRITMNGKCMDMEKCHKRAIKAADDYANEMRQVDITWKTASEYDNKRKERIYRDAVEVLKGMEKFNLQDYFAGMRARGWVVSPNTPDSNGVIHGYSIGEFVHEKDQTPLMYKASKLGHGYALTVKNLERTWQRIQDEERRASGASIQPTAQHPVQTPVKEKERDQQQFIQPVAKPQEPTVTYEHEGKPFNILKSIDDLIRSLIVLPTAADYADEEMNGRDYSPEMPELDEVAETAAAFYAGILTMPLDLAGGSTYVSSGGGGGSSSGIGKKDDDEEREKARRAAMAAGLMHAPRHGQKKIYRPRWHR